MGSGGDWFLHHNLITVIDAASSSSWDDLRIKFITQCMGERQLLKDVRCLDDVRQQEDESLVSYYSCFNKNLANIDEVITYDEAVQALIRGLGPKGKVVGNTFKVAQIYTPRKLTVRVKGCIDQEWIDERLVAYTGSSGQRMTPP